MAKTIAVFGASSSKQGDDHYEDATRCGSLLASAGFTVVTGGYGGSMEAVSLGAHRAGGHVIGVTAPGVFPGRSGANRYVSSEVAADTLIGRIGTLTELADASIALWGSLGTATELLVAWNEAFVAPFSGNHRKPVVAVGDPWRSLVPALESTLVTTPGVVMTVDTVEEAVDTVVDILGGPG